MAEREGEIVLELREPITYTHPTLLPLDRGV